MTQLPAVSLAAVPGRRLRTIELAKDIERRGFPGIFGPSLGDSLALCNAIALNTTDVMIGTSITPIYTRNVADFAQTAGFLHEVSEGRFRFGVGVSHAPALNRMGITAGKPLMPAPNHFRGKDWLHRLFLQAILKSHNDRLSSQPRLRAQALRRKD